MTESERVVLAPGAEESGLAVMMAQLIEQHLSDDPKKEDLLHKMRGRIALVAEDADTAATLSFAKQGITVHAGVVGLPDLTVRASSDDLINLGALPTFARFDVPDVRQPAVKQLLRSAINRKLKIYGGLARWRLLLSLGQIFSSKAEHGS